MAVKRHGAFVFVTTGMKQTVPGNANFVLYSLFFQCIVRACVPQQTLSIRCHCGSDGKIRCRSLMMLTHGLSDNMSVQKAISYVYSLCQNLVLVIVTRKELTGRDHTVCVCVCVKVLSFFDRSTNVASLISRKQSIRICMSSVHDTALAVFFRHLS